MDENELCFCGSGKKKSECHPKIHNESKAARVIKLYNKIDSMIDEHFEAFPYDAHCKNGCFECCFTDFPMSDIEMDIIFNEMLKWNPKQLSKVINEANTTWNIIKKKYPEYVNILHTNANQNIDVLLKGLLLNPSQKDFPCPFLDKERNSYKCLIYSYRPVTCRIHGLAFYNSAKQKDNNIRACSIINKPSNQCSWQADLSVLANEITSLNEIFMLPYNHPIQLRPYPMIYFIYKRFIHFGKPVIPADFEAKLYNPEVEYNQYMYDRVRRL